MTLARTAIRRRPKRHPVPPGVRERVYERAKGRCEGCGVRLVGEWELAHRQARGMGGTADPAAHALTNLLAFCRRTHRAATVNPRWAEAHGFMVRHGTDPSQVPVTLWDGRRVLLTAEGYEEVA